MAFTTVVSNSFTQKMIDALQHLEQQRGPITLAVMTPSQLGSGERWFLYLSALWLDRMSLSEGISSMREYFQNQLGPFQDRYQGTYVIRTSDSEVRTFHSKFDVSALGTAYRVAGLDLDRFEDNDAILFVTRPASLPHYSQKLSA